MKVLDKLTFRGRKSIPYERIIFLHIPKTAGSAISQHIISFLPNEKYMLRGDYFTIPQTELDSYFYISGHFDFNYIKHLLDGSYSFTFLRDPVERVISEYNFFLQLPATGKVKKLVLPVESFQRMYFEEFIESEASYIVNRQARDMCKRGVFTRNLPDKGKRYNSPEILEMAKSNLHKLSYVGFKETFKEDFHNILEELNVPLPRHNKIVNKTKYHPDQIDRHSLPRETLEKLEAKVRLDRKLYRYAWNNLKRA